jgi:WD40 repeat protein
MMSDGRSPDVRSIRARAATRFRHLALMATALLGACGKEDPKFIFEKKPIPELPYQGFRRDIPDERRGNAVFLKAVFTRDGRYLVTVDRGIHVFDATNGTLLNTLDATIDGNDVLVADGTTRTLLARRRDVAPNEDEARGLWIWNLLDGSRVGPIPEPSERERVRPIGITPKGEAIVVRSGGVEAWAISGSGRRLRVEPEPGREFCGTYDPIAHDRRCQELSHSGRWYVTMDRETANPSAPSWAWLIDLERGTKRRLMPPPGMNERGDRSFAFRPDETSLTMELTDGLWLGYPVTTDSTSENVGGQPVRGEHQRNLFLKPLTYTPDGQRIIAMGDQYTVATYDANTGALIGREKPPFEEREGAVFASADGSRVIAYRYVADILVVIDGTTGKQRGYLCPYFCNRAHNPVAVPYAVSPDGRRVATGGRLGAGLWDTDADTLIAPLRDPALPSLKPR